MTSIPVDLTDRPEATVSGMIDPDLLSQVLSQIRLSGDFVYSESLEPGSRLSLSPAEATICFVTEGALQRGDRTIETGDLLLLPRGMAHVDGDLIADGTTRLTICRFRFDPHTLVTLVSGLPDHIHIRREDGGGWLGNIAYFMMAEVGDIQPGASLMISRLIDLMIIRTLRTWVQLGGAIGWLGGLLDTRIARTLKAIHARPYDRWSLARLAATAGMSRSSFSGRFTELVGISPLRYHNNWRLTLARDTLKAGSTRVGDVALSVGYISEAAFSRAYKAQFGHSPAQDLPR